MSADEVAGQRILEAIDDDDLKSPQQYLIQFPTC